MNISIRIAHATHDGVPPAVLATARSIHEAKFFVAWADHGRKPRKYVLVYNVPRAADTAPLATAGFAHVHRALAYDAYGQYTRRAGWIYCV